MGHPFLLSFLLPSCCFGNNRRRISEDRNSSRLYMAAVADKDDGTNVPPEEGGKKWPFPKGLGPVYVTVFIDVISIALLIPVLPFFTLDIAREEFGANGTSSDISTQRAVVLAVTLTSGVFSIAQLFGSLIFGQLSDRWGRRPTILLSILGSGLGFIFTGLSNSVLTVVLARAFAGLFGGSIPVAQAYIIDVTPGYPQPERNKYLGLVGATIGMGFTIGPGIGAALVAIMNAAALPKRLTFSIVLFIAAGFCFLACFYAARRLKEPERTDAGQPSTAAATASGDTGACAWLGANPRVLTVCFAAFCVMYAFNVMQSTYAIMIDERFGCSSPELGAILVGCGISIIILQVKFIKPLSRRLGSLGAAILACCLLGSGMILYSLTGMKDDAGSIIIHLLGFLVHNVGFGITQPMLPAVNSYHAGKGKTGRALGLSQAAQAFARALSPFVSGLIYYDVWGPGHVLAGALPYLVGAGFSFVAALVLSYLHVVAPMKSIPAAPVASSPEGTEENNGSEAKADTGLELSAADTHDASKGESKSGADSQDVSVDV